MAQMAGEKDFVKLRRVNEIPADLLEGFRRDAEASDACVKRVFNSDFKIGAFYKGTIAGFVTAYFSMNGKEKVLSVPALYVKPGFRGKGIAKKLMYRSLGEAKKLGFAGINITYMQQGMRAVFGRQREKWNGIKNKPFSRFESVKVLEDGKKEAFGKIRFRKQRAV